MKNLNELPNKATRIIEESINAINYLVEKQSQGDYKGGIIGPAVGSLFTTAILLREIMKKESWKTKRLLENFYDSYTKTPLNDRKTNDQTIIKCVRDALAHDNFQLNIDYLEFWNDYGNLKIHYSEMSKFQNTLVKIYNQNRI